MEGRRHSNKMQRKLNERRGGKEESVVARSRFGVEARGGGKGHDIKIELDERLRTSTTVAAVYVQPREG